MSETTAVGFWYGAARGIIDQLSDVFGARLVMGAVVTEKGDWNELRSYLPVGAKGAQIVLVGESQARVGLIWAATDASVPQEWLESDDVRHGLWDAVESAIATELSAQWGQSVRVSVGAESPADELGKALGLDQVPHGTLLICEASGDGVSFFLGLVMSEEIAAALVRPLEPEEGTVEKSAAGLPSGEKVQARPAYLPPLRSSGRKTATSDLDLIMDLPLKLTAEIGSAQILIKDMLALGTGSVIELDRPAGEPIDVLVNGKLVAKGEIVVLPDGDFGVRVVEIINSRDRLGDLKTTK